MTVDAMAAEAAATRVQSVYKGAATRRAAAEEASAREAAAAAVQGAWRERSAVKASRLQQVVAATMLASSAGLVQKMLRGRAARKEAEELRVAEEGREALMEGLQRLGAVQKVARRSRSRGDIR